MSLSPEFYGKRTSLAVYTLDTNFPIQNIYHPFHQSQSQTVALGCVRSIPLIEFFKNMLTHFRFDAAAGIPDRNHHQGAFGFQADAYGSALRREFDRIGEQIISHKTQKLPVRPDPDIVFDICFNAQVLLFPDILKLQQILTKLFSQIIFIQFGKDLLIFQLVQL